MKRNAESEDNVPSQETNALGSTGPSTVRDQLWLWGHDAGAHNEGWGLPRPSRITPAEAACYLGLPNLIMVRYRGRPPPVLGPIRPAAAGADAGGLVGGRGRRPDGRAGA